MYKTAVLSLLGLVLGMASSAANAQFFHHSVGYSDAVRPAYSAPVLVRHSTHYHAVPVVAVRPVYVSPIVQTVYAAPVYTTPVYAAPVYTAPVYSTSVYATPVPVSRVVSPPAVVYESLKVRPNSTTYRAQGYGFSVHERTTRHGTVTRVRGR